MEPQAILDRLKQQFEPWITGSDVEAIDHSVTVTPEGLAEVCRFLRDEEDLQFNLLHCITGVDYFQPDPKKAAKLDWEPHLEVLYHLSSLTHRHRLVLRVELPRWKDDQAGSLPELSSVCGIWRTADWHEREVFDLVGVRFVGHPNLLRILCPEDWVGHPLRKDYQMPTEYHGIRGR